MYRGQDGFTAPQRRNVEGKHLAPEDACSRDTLVPIHWHGRNVAIPLSQLVPTEANESTAEAIRDWHYGLARG